MKKATKKTGASTRRSFKKAGQRGARKVFVNLAEVQELEKTLAEAVLPHIQEVSGEQQVLITSRLNQAGKEFPAPIWYAWVESPELRGMKGRKIKIDAIRSALIGGTHNSPIYSRCLTHTDRSYIHEVDYSKQGREGAEKTPDAKKFDNRLKINHRRFIAILANNRRVGTLTLGFLKAPANDDAVNEQLRYFAQRDQSPLVQYLLKSGIKLGGPRI